MNPLSLSAPLLPPTPAPLQAGAITPIAAVAFAAAEAELPLPQSQPLAALPAATPGAGAEQQDGAAMRPDQVFMSRQMSFPQADGRTLAGNWRTMVGNYGATLLERAQRMQEGALAPALLLAGQEGRSAARLLEGQVLPADAWRFTVHAGSASAQHLQVVRKTADGSGGRRRHARAALRLELELADGTVVAVQVEPAPGGVAIEMMAPDVAALARLRALQPALDAAVERAGLLVVRWSFRTGIAPAGSAHAVLEADEVAEVLTLPVFRAVAELALMLPAQA